MKDIVECVPNYSEGRDMQAIRHIVDAIASVDGIKVLNVDPGQAANRTVVTFVGESDKVTEAAFRGAKAAKECIDMRKHHGTHPRSGSTDVLPLVPVSGITLGQCAVLARELAARMYRELGIPCYCYEAAAFKPERKNLAVCRSGEYEALPAKMADPALKPDFSGTFDEDAARCGASNVGARNFLIAVNFNLDTTSVEMATEIAMDVREKGRKATDGGEFLKDENGKQIWIPGPLKGCKAIGWYIEEYGIAQVSMNITDIGLTPLHEAFEEVSRAASRRGVRVSGTEIIGLVPKIVLTDAGRFYLQRKGAQEDPGEGGLIELAIKSMSLDDLKPFDPRKKVIEYLMEDSGE